MTKKELIKWVDNKMHEALSAVENEKAAEIQAYKEKLYESINLDSHANAIVEKYNELDKVIGSFNNDLPNSLKFYPSYGYGLNISSRYRSFEDTKKAIINCLHDESKQLQQINNKYDNILSQVKRNYENLIINVQSLANAKLGIEYLESLGFKVDYVENKTECTALACPIDTSFLFVGGNNDEGKSN